MAKKPKQTDTPAPEAEPTTPAATELSEVHSEAPTNTVEPTAPADPADPAGPVEQPAGEDPSVFAVDNADMTNAPETVTPTAFRVVFETRDLVVKFKPSEMTELVHRLVEIPRDLERVKNEKKAAASHFKAEIDKLEEEQREVGVQVEDGGRTRAVRCKWEFKTSGMDSATGELIPHPNKKSLVRTDTGDVIEVIEMAAKDYDHLELNLGLHADTVEDLGDDQPGAEDMEPIPTEGTEGTEDPAVSGDPAAGEDA